MPTLNTYSDVIAILSYAPHCDDVADAILRRLALEAAGERLLAGLASVRVRIALVRIAAEVAQ